MLTRRAEPRRAATRWSLSQKAAAGSPGRGSVSPSAGVAVMKYRWWSRAVINVAKSPSRPPLDDDDVLSSYIGIILPSSSGGGATCNAAEPSCWTSYITTSSEQSRAPGLRWLFIFSRGSERDDTSLRKVAAHCMTARIRVIQNLRNKAVGSLFCTWMS